MDIPRPQLYIPFGNENSWMVYEDFFRNLPKPQVLSRLKLLAILRACSELYAHHIKKSVIALALARNGKTGILTRDGYIMFILLEALEGNLYDQANL